MHWLRRPWIRTGLFHARKRFAPALKTLERRIDEHTRRKREGEQARDELASEIERLTSLSLKNLEPASEMLFTNACQ